MKICLISKYPPIEGGESSKVYWLARALGKRGHEVHVVTNAGGVEPPYRETILPRDKHEYAPVRVHVHQAAPLERIFHIPRHNPYGEKLASTAIDVILKYDLQIIDAWYLLPYAVSGYLAKSFTGRPLLVRHAGSDLYGVLNRRCLRTLFTSIFKKADMIVTYGSTRNTFRKMGIPAGRMYVNFGVSVDSAYFNPSAAPIDLVPYTDIKTEGAPLIGHIGKIGRKKQVYELIEAAAGIKKYFFLLFVSQGERLSEFKAFVKEKKMSRRTIFLDFLPPWKIPGLLKRLACLVYLEDRFPFAHYPVIPREAMAVGTCVIMNNESHRVLFQGNPTEGSAALAVNPANILQFRRLLESVLVTPGYAEETGFQGLAYSRRIEWFDDYVDRTAALYERTMP